MNANIDIQLRLTIGPHTAELSTAEANELYEKLHKLFGEQTTYIPTTYPTIIREHPYWPSWREVWYSTGSAPNVDSALNQISLSYTDDEGG